jgi:hypothetical protein
MSNNKSNNRGTPTKPAPVKVPRPPSFNAQVWKTKGTLKEWMKEHQLWEGKDDAWFVSQTLPALHQAVAVSFVFKFLSASH